MIVLWLSCTPSNQEDSGTIEACDIDIREEFTLQESECPQGICSVWEGEFIMGEGSHDAPDQCPQRKVFLSSFSIDETEVTVAQYQNCVSAGACTDAPYCPSQANIQNPGQLPRTCITWFQAQEYCSWKGGTLPTEAQWEKAARGTTGASWPWGQSPPSCGVANFRYSPAYCAGGPVEVGSYAHVSSLVSEIPTARSPFGLLDTVGNVWEWTADWYDAGYFRYAPDIDPEGPQTCSVDIGGTQEECTEKVMKGGAYNTLQDITKASVRAFLAPNLHDDNIGFRCAYP